MLYTWEEVAEREALFAGLDHSFGAEHFLWDVSVLGGATVSGCVLHISLQFCSSYGYCVAVVD